MDVPPIETLRALWYAGLGQAYRATRNGFSMSLCSDSPSIRRFFYGVIVLSMGVSGTACCIAAYTVTAIAFLPLICVLVAGICFDTAYRFFKAYRALTKAQSSGGDTDLSDPMRIRAFQRAYAWGRKYRKIRKDDSGKEIFIA